MPTLLLSIVLSVLVISLIPAKTHAWGNPELLVELNDTSMNKQDFLDWWEIWKEADTPLPETPDDFIDWMLLFQEADNMQLYDHPVYLKKVSVFLRARSLMLFKQEEIDSKISPPTQEELWPYYIKKYVPRFNLKMVSIETEEASEPLVFALAGGATLDAAAEQAGLLDTPAFMAETGLMRPGRLPGPMLDAVMQKQVGDMGGPVSIDKYTYFFEVLERDDGSDEDFATLRDSLTRQWEKLQVKLLTNELVARLKVKYEVEINEELVAQIGLEPLDPEIASQVALQIAEVQVTASTLQQSIAKDYKLRYRKHKDQGEALVRVRKRVIADMLNQTLIGMEAMARHYEEQEPFRKSYRYYCQNNIIKILTQELIAPNVVITEADIEAAYRENINAFTRTGLVEIALVKTKENELAQLIEGRLLQGEEFNKVVAPIAPLGVKVEKIPLDHLEKPVKEAIAGMRPGQVSRMIPVGDELVFVKLIKRNEGQVKPLEMVRAQVESDLKQQRFQAARAELLAQLRDRSRIKVKEKAWRQVVAQLESEGGKNLEQ